jgi:hypothetical protein
MLTKQFHSISKFLFQPSNESQVDFNRNVSPDNPETEVGVDDGNNDTIPQENESDLAEEASQTEGAPQQQPNRTRLRLVCITGRNFS